MSRKRPPLSKTEWLIMHLCWRLGRATARQVHEQSDGTRDYRTVKTLLDRIASKGYLEVQKRGRLSLYRPVISRRSAASQAVGDFIENVLENSVAPLYLHLAGRDDLTPEEIEFFKSKLGKKEEGDD